MSVREREIEHYKAQTAGWHDAAINRFQYALDHSIPVEQAFLYGLEIQNQLTSGQPRYGEHEPGQHTGKPNRTWLQWSLEVFGGQRGDLIDESVNFNAAIEDTLTFGISWLIRDKVFGINVVDYESNGYYYGGWAGLAGYLVLGSRWIQGGLRLLGKTALKSYSDDAVEVVAKNAPVSGGKAFIVDPRVIPQLADSRLGALAGKITPQRLHELVNNNAARRFFDVRSGNINVIQEVEGRLIRITVAGDKFKVISIGPIQERNILNLIKNGGFFPLP